MKRKISFFFTIILLSMSSVLAQEPETCNIVLVSNPPEVLGIGGAHYSYGTIFTFCISFPINGYEFVSWTEDSIIVSTELCLTFTVTQSCTLVANFIQTTDVIDITEISAVNIYPNPTTGELTIDNGQLTINSVEIIDIYGRKLSSHHLIVLSSHHRIDISHLQLGIYFVRVLTEKGAITKKILKH